MRHRLVDTVCGLTLASAFCGAVKGVFASDSGIVGDVVGDFAAALLNEVPAGSAQLFMLSSGMESEAATDTVVNWFEEGHHAGRTTLNEALDGSETDIDVVDASFLVPGTICLVETSGEQVYITATTGNTVTVIRGFAGTTAATASSGSGFQKLSNAQEEASNKPVAVTFLGAPRYNYVQLFRNTWNISGTAQAVQFYTGSKAAKTKRDASMIHAEDIERALWFGRKTVGVVNGMRFMTMDGMDAQITTNVTAAGGTTNWSQVDAFLQTVFAYNIKGKPNERVAVMGNGALAVLNNIARIEGTYTISNETTEFGLSINRWKTPYGSISLLTHPLFNESPVWTKDIRIFHPGALKMRWLRRTFEDTYDRNGTRAGVDADFGVFTSELTMQYNLERTGGRMTGLTAAAAIP